MSGTEELFAALYDELSAVAAEHLRRESAGTLLQPPDLLHEAYLRLAGRPGFRWESPWGFYAVAAATMRRVLVDHHRARTRQKRGGAGARRVKLEADELLAPPQDVDLVDLDAALQELAREHPKWVRVVELRFFGGMSESQAAEALQVPAHRVRRQWYAARAWLRRRLAQGDGG